MEKAGHPATRNRAPASAVFSATCSAVASAQPLKSVILSDAEGAKRLRTSRRIPTLRPFCHADTRCSPQTAWAAVLRVCPSLQPRKHNDLENLAWEPLFLGHSRVELPESAWRPGGSCFAFFLSAQGMADVRIGGTLNKSKREGHIIESRPSRKPKPRRTGHPLVSSGRGKGGAPGGLLNRA
jgi:hypothetical protein